MSIYDCKFVLDMGQQHFWISKAVTKWTRHVMNVAWKKRGVHLEISISKLEIHIQTHNKWTLKYLMTIVLACEERWSRRSLTRGCDIGGCNLFLPRFIFELIQHVFDGSNLVLSLSALLRWFTIVKTSSLFRSQLNTMIWYILLHCYTCRTTTEHCGKNRCGAILSYGENRFCNVRKHLYVCCCCCYCKRECILLDRMLYEYVLFW